MADVKPRSRRSSPGVGPPPAGGTSPQPLSRRSARKADDAAQDALAGLTGRPDLGLLRQIWRFRQYGRAELRPLLTGVGMRVGELASDLATPWPLALIIDHVLKGNSPTGALAGIAGMFGPTPVAMLAVAALGVLVITSLSGMFDYLGDRTMNSAGERITSSIRTNVFAHLQRLPMGFHDRQAVGELTSRIATDTGRIEDGLVGLFSTLIPGVLSLAGYTIVLLSLDWRLGLIALCAAPLLFVTAARYTKLTRKSTRRRRAAEGRLSGFVAESLQGIRTIHAFGRQDLHDQRFNNDNATVLKTGLRAVELRARFTPLLEAIAAVGTATLLFVGGYGVINGWWSVGVLVVVTSYLRDMLKPMRALSGLALTFTQGAASAERVAAIFDQQRPDPSPDTTLPHQITGEIELREVGLDYGRGPVLTGIDLLIHPGERIALLGHNGAGKSTLLSLISGLYPPTSGAVLLDGIPLTDVPTTWRYQQVAVVLQDTFLFSGTIRDNIRYGRPDATDTDVTHAATAALVTKFTDQLDDGLDTELSDGGIGLSGGQRQRVGIARALLTNAPIVLLDEPTTGLDTQAEELVVQALTSLVTDRTVVMTTHRPALTRLATRVVHLANGALTDEPIDPALLPAAAAVASARPGSAQADPVARTVGLTRAVAAARAAGSVRKAGVARSADTARGADAVGAEAVGAEANPAPAVNGVRRPTEPAQPRRPAGQPENPRRPQRAEQPERADRPERREQPQRAQQPRPRHAARTQPMRPAEQQAPEPAKQSGQPVRQPGAPAWPATPALPSPPAERGGNGRRRIGDFSAAIGVSDAAQAPSADLWWHSNETPRARTEQPAGPSGPDWVDGEWVTGAHTNGTAPSNDTAHTNGAAGSNGHTNGVPHTNGHTNGAARNNGHTNRAARTNGVPHTNGHTYGVARANGHTNGSGNGVARTNGRTNDASRDNWPDKTWPAESRSNNSEPGGV